jgi:hypothetical protein
MAAASCPKCGRQDGLRTVTSDDREGAAIFWVGGLLAYLSHRDTHKNRLVCARCAFVFSPAKKPEPEGWLAVIMLIAVVIITGALVWIIAGLPTGS